MKLLLVCFVVSSLCLAYTLAAGVSCNCGWRNKQGRIVGGKATGNNEYPWMVALSSGGGGAIISPNHVLTAASNLDQVVPSTIRVLAGMVYRRSGPNPNLQQINVIKAIKPRDYSKINNQYPVNDIAILVLEKPLTFNQFVGPVCMPSSAYNLQGKFVKVTGWGLTMNTGNMNTLSEVDIQVVSNDVCKRSWSHDIRSNQICAYSPQKGSCRGDDGGPMVYLDPDTNRFTLVGIMSYAPTDCVNDAKPSVNTDVFAFNSLIQNAIKSTYPSAQVCTKV